MEIVSLAIFHLDFFAIFRFNHHQVYFIHIHKQVSAFKQTAPLWVMR